MEKISLNIPLLLNSKSICVQIGAFDGVSNDSFFLGSIQVDQEVCKIILIEPIKEYFDQLEKNYGERKNFFFENIGISDSDKFETFYVNGQDTSIVRSHPDSEKRIIKCHNFDYIINKYELTHIDFLIIDVEGYEYVLLKNILYNSKIEIKHIRFEFWHLSKEDQINLDELLIYNGYEVYMDEFSYADKIAIKKN